MSSAHRHAAPASVGLALGAAQQAHEDNRGRQDPDELHGGPCRSARRRRHRRARTTTSTAIGCASARPIFSMQTCGTIVLKPRVPYTSTEYTDESVEERRDRSQHVGEPFATSLRRSRRRRRASGRDDVDEQRRDDSDAANDIATAIRMFARNSCCLPIARSRLIVRISPVAAPISHILDDDVEQRDRDEEDTRCRWRRAGS